MLQKSLTKVGNSYALVLDRTLMDLVGITPDVPVTIQAKGDSLIISSSSTMTIDNAIDEVFQTHGEALRRLSR